MAISPEEFDTLLKTAEGAVKQLVCYRISSKADAEDILQETFLAAFKNRDTLRDKSSFKPWLIRIANNFCSRYYRKTVREFAAPLDEWELPAQSRPGFSTRETVAETFASLGKADQQILALFYYRELSVAQIAQRLEIPAGTVKSRLHNARRRFRDHYPYPPKHKGEHTMSHYSFPETLPEIKIAPSDTPVFPVVFEELPGWFIIPRLHQKAAFAVYPYPQKTCDEIEELEARGEAAVHGIPCVEISCTQTDSLHEPHPEYLLYASADNTCVRYLANFSYHRGVRTFTTFLDDSFLKNWGIGINNSGRETHLQKRGVITEDTDGNVKTDGKNRSDILGAFELTLGAKRFRAVKFVEHLEEGIYTESYIDETCRTVLWRRYNRMDGKTADRKGQPQSPQLTVNGEPYILGFDCLGDHVL